MGIAIEVIVPSLLACGDQRVPVCVVSANESTMSPLRSCHAATRGSKSLKEWEELEESKESKESKESRESKVSQRVQRVQRV